MLLNAGLDMETESECDENGVVNEWMNTQGANGLRSKWYKKESEEEKMTTPRTRQKMGRPKRDTAKEHSWDLQMKYNEHIQDERCKFRRRVLETIKTSNQQQTHALPENADLMETAFDGKVCNMHANMPLEPVQ